MVVYLFLALFFIRSALPSDGTGLQPSREWQMPSLRSLFEPQREVFPCVHGSTGVSVASSSSLESVHEEVQVPPVAGSTDFPDLPLRLQGGLEHVVRELIAG